MFGLSCFSLRDLQGNGDSIFSARLGNFGVSQDFEASSSMSLVPKIVAYQVVALFFTFSRSTEGTDKTRELAPVCFLCESSHRGFVSDGAVSILPEDFFALSFVVAPRMSDTMPVPSSLDLMGDSCAGSAYGDNSPPSAMAPPSLPGCRQCLGVFFATSSAGVSSPTFLSRISKL